jgi:hypothetical protein
MNVDKRWKMVEFETRSLQIGKKWNYMVNQKGAFTEIKKRMRF